MSNLIFDLLRSDPPRKSDQRLSSRSSWISASLGFSQRGRARSADYTAPFMLVDGSPGNIQAPPDGPCPGGCA